MRIAELRQNGLRTDSGEDFAQRSFLVAGELPLCPEGRFHPESDWTVTEQAAEQFRSFMEPEAESPFQPGPFGKGRWTSTPSFRTRSKRPAEKPAFHACVCRAGHPTMPTQWRRLPGPA